MSLAGFVQSRLKYDERKIAREMKPEALRRALTDSLDALLMPMAAGSDLVVRRLPPSLSCTPRAFYRRLEIRDALQQCVDLWSADELRIALLWLRGHSPLVIFRTLGIPPATGYRRYARLFSLLREVCHV